MDDAQTWGAGGGSAVRRRIIRGGVHDLEILVAEPSGGGSARPPLLFLHGAFSAAWVWAEHFLPYFVRRGFPVRALSFRGHGRSSGGGSLDSFGISDYVRDVEMVLEVLGRPPVVIGHSLGGLVAQLLVQKLAPSRRIRGLVLMAAVPPEGILGLNWRIALTDPELWTEAVLITAADPQRAPVSRMRRAMFSDDLPERLSLAYYLRMQRESRRALAEAQWPLVWCSAAGLGLPVLALAGGRDPLIPADAVARTAWFHGGELRGFDDMAHAMMLEPRWVEVAERTLEWLERRGF